MEVALRRINKNQKKNQRVAINIIAKVVIVQKVERSYRSNKRV